MPKPLTEEQLLAAVKLEAETSIGFWTDDIAGEQDINLRRYLGFPYGDEVPGRSSVVSHDCAQVVDWALPDIIEPFAGGTDIATFQPNSEQEIPQARQASDYLNNLYYQQNQGFMNMYTVLKDGFIQKIGVSKVVWVTDESVITEELFGLTEAQLGDISDDELIEIIEMEPGEERPPSNNTQGPQIVVTPPTEFTVDIKFKRRQRGKATVIAIPPEEFRISSRSSSLNDARYKAHVSELTKGALVSMGFDKSVVEDLPSPGDSVDLSIRRDTRFSDESDSNPDPSDTLTSDRVLLHEEYITIDMDGDGDEEIMQVFRVGNTILESKEIDDHPFVSFCPEMIPHKFFGQSLVDKAKETQRVKTVLTRQMLDNVYLANNPQREVPDEAVGDHTISDLLTYRVGGLVRTRRPNMIREIPIADRSATALAAIQYMDTVKELDSGITRNSTGVPTNVDREKTAAEINKVDRGENARKRLIARVFAETYLVPMFEKLLKLTVKYQDYTAIIEVRGQWVEMDPKYWNGNMKAGIQIGLGYLEKQDLLAAARQILAMQIQGLDQGMAGPEELWNTADIIVQTSGLKFTNRFFKRPEEIPPAKPKPNPEELRQQTEMAKIESMTRVKMAEAELENQIDQLKEQNKQAIATQDTQFDFQVELKKIEDNFRLKLRQQDLEAQLALREQNLEAGLKVREQGLSGAQLNGGGVRFGGTIG